MSDNRPVDDTSTLDGGVDSSEADKPSVNLLEIPPADGRCIINELPPELLSYIFRVGSLVDREENGGPGTGEKDDCVFELLITQVCGHWRNVAIELSMLWCDIDFHVEDHSPFDLQKMYLSRSKLSPLNIVVDCTNDDDPEFEPEDDETGDFENNLYFKKMKAILEIILPHVGHWHAIEIMVAEYFIIHYVLQQLGQCEGAPMLEILQLGHYEGPEDDEIVIHPKYFLQDFVLFNGHAPRLTHVSLWGVHLNWDRAPFLAGLCDFELAYHAEEVRPSYLQFSRILRASPELVTLTLSSSGPKGDAVDWLKSITEADPLDASLDISLPLLENLVFHEHPEAFLSQLIDRLALPKLANLNLSFENNDDYSDILTKFCRTHPLINKSLFSGLVSLKIGAMFCTYTAAREMYAVLTNLTSINLNFEFIDRMFYVFLLSKEDIKSENYDATPSGEVFLPRLESLSASGIDGGDMKKLVISRRDAGHALKRVFMNPQDDVEEDVQRWLENNLEQFDYFEDSDDEDDDAIIEIDVDADFDEDDEDEDEDEDEDDVAYQYENEEDADDDEDAWEDLDDAGGHVDPWHPNDDGDLDPL